MAQGRFACDGVRLTIEIKDNGVGFAPACRHERPAMFVLRGYGMSIMRVLMDAVEYSEGGTRVRLVKRLEVSFTPCDPTMRLPRVRQGLLCAARSD